MRSGTQGGVRFAFGTVQLHRVSTTGHRSSNGEVRGSWEEPGQGPGGPTLRRLLKLGIPRGRAVARAFALRFEFRVNTAATRRHARESCACRRQNVDQQRVPQQFWSVQARGAGGEKATVLLTDCETPYIIEWCACAHVGYDLRGTCTAVRDDPQSRISVRDLTVCDRRPQPHQTGQNSS